MGYNLIITENADEQIDAAIHYLLNKFEDSEAASRLLDGISAALNRLEANPYQFPKSSDVYLESKDYHEALIRETNYKIVFRIDAETVYIVGFFHDLEDHSARVAEWRLLD